MTVLVTGGAGYVGSHMALELLDHGEDVVVIDDLSTGERWAVPERASFHQGDAGDGEFVRSVIAQHRIDAVIHLAGSVDAQDSLDRPLQHYRNNTSGSRNLLEAVTAAGIDKFVYSSTAAVYGNPMTAGPIREDAVLNPLTPHATSKLMTEMMLRDVAAASPLRYVMLRYFDVAGADPHRRSGHSLNGGSGLVREACQAALGKITHVTIHGTERETVDGSPVRDIIHVGDLANAHLVALNFLRQGGLKFTGNCGYSRGFSALEVVEAAKRISGRDFPVVHLGKRPGEPSTLVANSNRLQARLSWQPRHGSLDAIVRHALAWEASVGDRKKSA